MSVAGARRIAQYIPKENRKKRMMAQKGFGEHLGNIRGGPSIKGVARKERRLIGRTSGFGQREELEIVVVCRK